MKICKDRLSYLCFLKCTAPGTVNVYSCSVARTRDARGRGGGAGFAYPGFWKWRVLGPFPPGCGAESSTLHILLVVVVLVVIVIVVVVVVVGGDGACVLILLRLGVY